jgi:DNA repair protein RecO (recombination protein O)
VNDEDAEGIVLRVRPATETSLVVTWLTAQAGRVATLAKGARRPRSPFGGKLDLCFRAEFSFRRSLRSDLHLLREVRLVDTHRRLRADLDCLRQAAAAVALVEMATESETPLPEIFSLMCAFLARLAPAPPPVLLRLAFEARLLGELGLGPGSAPTRLSPGAQALLEEIVGGDWDRLDRLQPAHAHQAELDRFLGGWMAEHLGRVPARRPSC